ncbi:MAG TPA: sigma 54-interacting transcriptional regulator [Rectinema sp.]|nr:sigma 54-interacting transcriptional regulator [Rectinema sp.]
MKRLIYFDQDFRRIRPIIRLFSKYFDISVAGDLLELSIMIQRQKPEILIVGLISSDSDFNARQKEIMKKIVPSSLEIYYFHNYLELNDIITSVSEKSNKEHLPSCGDKASGAKPRHADSSLNIIGKSKKIGHLISQIRMLANESCSVMIIGETGTGKELAARALHEWSDRRSNPFLALNCAAIPYTLFESEMFGTERGAYTDASSRSGIIEQANNGTLFLDEIGSLSPVSQPCLLRVLDNGEFRRLGSLHSRSSKFRLVTASSRNPIELASQHEFRDDLLFRIANFVIETPPLRERKEDIPLLAQHFCDQYSIGRFNIGSDALDKMYSHNWPGNVRELFSVIMSACSLRKSGKICAKDIHFLPGIEKMSDQRKRNSR